MKFLVIRFSSIGDIVLTTPAIRCLKQQLPNAEVHFVCKLSMKDVLIANPYIDKFHYYKKNLNELIASLKKEKFDYIIDLHKNFRSYRIRLALKTKTYSYRKLSVQKFILTKLHIDLMPGRHISLRCIDALKPLGIKDDGEGLDYFIPEKNRLKEGDLPLTHQLGFIAIVIGASYFTKRLPVEKLKQLCVNINYPVVLIGGKDDATVAHEVALTDEIKIYNACGKFSLNESAAIVQQANLVISHDTGMQYIACAFNKKVLAIWGATSPKLDVEPFYGTNNPSLHKNIIVKNLHCQPCSNYGTKTCPQKHFKCMRLQNTDEIANNALALAKLTSE